MKKSLLVLSFVLFGCAELMAPSETARNSRCADTQRYEIFNVFDEGALAWACDYPIGKCGGMTVFIPANKSDRYYDGKTIEPDDDKCIAFGGVYNYINKKDGVHKTVPVIEMTDDMAPNPDYAKWLKETVRK